MKHIYLTLLIAAGAAFGQPIQDAEILGVGGQCLDANPPATNQAPGFSACRETAQQKWQVPTRNTDGPIIAASGRCLDVAAANPSDGTAVQLFPCHGGGNQRWRHEGNGQIVGLAGKCLTANSSEHGLALASCAGAVSQLFLPRTFNRWNRSNLDTGAWGVAVTEEYVYAATTERLYRSDDQGTSWAGLPLTRPRGMFEVDLARPQRLFVGSSEETGLLPGRSTDGGQTWQVLADITDPLRDLAIHGEDSNILLAASSVSAIDLYRSSDGGDSWSEIEVGERLRRVEFSKATPSLAYALSGSYLYRSTDAGATWQQIREFLGPQQIAPHPVSAGTIYVDDFSGIQRSDDFGNSWTVVSEPFAFSQLNALEVMADGTLYAAYEQSIHQSSDGGETWSWLVTGTQPRYFSDLTSHPSQPNQIWAAEVASVFVGEFDTAPTFGFANGRFQAQITWTDFAGNTGYGVGQYVSRDTLAFWFFDPDNIEVVVKILDGTSLNGHHWAFYGALSNVEYTLTIEDRHTGRVRHYENPLGHFASVGDTSAFPLFGDPANLLAASGSSLEDEITAAASNKMASSLELADGRFLIEAEWRDFAGNTGQGMARPLTNDTGTFWFFEYSNIELIVKVLDGRPVNGHFWVFYGALSNVEYSLTVTDQETGQVQIYTNPTGNFASVGDTAAF